jgi:sensor histidine kinase regulating citrate/malate metabolism
MATELDSVVEALGPAIRSSLDAVCVVNERAEIVHMNRAAKALLGLRKSSSQKKPVFCGLLKLAACAGGCQIEKAIRKAQPFRLDEAPAALGDTKLRLTLQAVPVFAPGDSKSSQAIGAVINVRDTTAEVILQAKYHKVVDLLVERELTIAEQEDKIHSLQSTLKRAAVSRVAR